MALVAIIMCISYTACSSESKEEPAPPQKKPIEEFNQGNMSFTEGADEQSFSFVANEAWTISVATTKADEAWCKVSPTSGGAGSHVVKITTTENTSYDDRSVTITLKSGSESKSFVVTQKQKDALLLTSDKVEIEQKGGTFTIEVKANVSYTATIGETCKSWITEGSNTRALSTSTKTYSVAASEESEKREGTITFTAGNLSETVHIYQAGGDIILLTKDEYYVDAAGENITVELKSNCDYEVEMPNVDWIHTTSTRGMSSHTLYYAIDANEGYDSRKAKIIYRNKENNIADTLTIIQAQRDAIILGKKEMTVKAEGETIEVKLSANVDYEVVMPEVDWISSVSTRGLTEHTLYYTVAKNESDDERVAKITFKNAGSNIADTLAIIQEGQMPVAKITIHVAEPGTLGNDIAESRLSIIKEIKITGKLNWDDLKTIYKMTSLKILDLSEADLSEKQIAEGQLPTNIECFYAPNNIQKIIGKFIYKRDEILDTGYKEYGSGWLQSSFSSGYYTVGNTHDTFDSELKNIELPASLTEIGEAAFSGTQLKKIKIPKGVKSIERWAFWNCQKLEYIEFSRSLSMNHTAFNTCGQNTLILDFPDLTSWLKSSDSYMDRDFENRSYYPKVKYPNIQLYINHSLLANSITIPHDITKVRENAFRNCSSLTEVIIGDQVTKIDDDAFRDCTNLSTVKFGDGIKEICDRAFYHCANLSQVEIKPTVETIGLYAFAGCESIKQITIPNSVKELGGFEFANCKNLTKIIIGDGVENLPGSFAGCVKLDTIHIGRNVKSCSYDIFRDVPGNVVYCYSTKPPHVDYQEGKRNTLYVPKGTYQAYFLSVWADMFKNIIEMDE